MTHKYINMYLQINYESKFIYKYKIITHWEIVSEIVFINNIYLQIHVCKGFKTIHKFVYEGTCLYFKL